MCQSMVCLPYIDGWIIECVMGEYDVYSDGLHGTVFTPFFRVPHGSNLSLLSVKNNTILELKSLYKEGN